MNRKRAGQYAAAVILAAAVFTAGAITQNLFQEEDIQKKLGILSDCFLFPAVLLGGMGGLSWAASEGTFDMLQYGFYMVFQRLLHPHKTIEGFYEYKVSREESRDGWLKHFLIIGLICLFASVICLLLYMASGG